MNKDRFKFRAYTYTPSRGWFMVYSRDNLAGFFRNYEFDPIMQWTGLYDSEGVEIYFGYLVNICYQSGEGEHLHDCVYSAVKDDLGGLKFRFERLLWEDYGHNQYPNSRELCQEHGTLGVRYVDGKPVLIVKDTWSENQLYGARWKGNDQSLYFKVIGNRYQNPELLENSSG